MNNNWTPLGEFIRREFKGDNKLFFDANRSACSQLKTVSSFVKSGQYYVVDGTLVKVVTDIVKHDPNNVTDTLALQLIERQDRGENIRSDVLMSSIDKRDHARRDTVYTLTDDSKIYYSPAQTAFYILKHSGRNVDLAYNKTGI